MALRKYIDNESGSLNEYGSSGGGGVSIVDTPVDAMRSGRYGLQVSIKPGVSQYALYSERWAIEGYTMLGVRVFVNFDNLTLAEGEELIFGWVNNFDMSDNLVETFVKTTGGIPYVGFRAKNPYPLSPVELGPYSTAVGQNPPVWGGMFHVVEYNMERETTSSAEDGSITCRLNGNIVGSDNTIRNNSTWPYLLYAFFGAKEAPAGTGGYLYFDDIAIRNDLTESGITPQASGSAAPYYGSTPPQIAGHPARTGFVVGDVNRPDLAVLLAGKRHG